MPTFAYKAKQGPDRTVRGVIDAVSRGDAANELDARGLMPIEIREQADTGQRGRAIFRRRVTRRDIITFTYQLASLLRSGVPMLRALMTIRRQTESLPFQRIVSEIERRVRDGQMLSEALAVFPERFSDLYLNMVRSGESGGVLDTVLNRLAGSMDSEDELRQRVQSAMAYPMLTISVGIVTVFVLLSFFLPRVLELFDTYDRLPLPTRILVGTSDFLSVNWYWFVLLALLGYAILRRLLAHEKGRVVLDGLRLRIPLLRRFLLMTDVARFSRTLALLLEAGLPIERALTLSLETMGNRVLRAEVDSVREQTVSQGMPFSEGLKHATHIPVFVANMCAVGEEGGRLDASLLEVAQFYERQVERQCRLAVSLLEPIMILLVGAVVGFIVAAMLLPIFEIGTRM